ncbi:unnamed protein product, partial [marine sediment metagenome]
MPIAGSFVFWLAGIVGSAFAYRKAKKLLRQYRFTAAVLCLAAAIAVGTIAISNMSQELVIAADSTPNIPIGIAKGIYPGRVVWVHDPNATEWDGYYSPEHWWQEEHTDLAAVEKMVSKAIRG